MKSFVWDTFWWERKKKKVWWPCVESYEKIQVQTLTLRKISTPIHWKAVLSWCTNTSCLAFAHSEWFWHCNIHSLGTTALSDWATKNDTSCLRRSDGGISEWTFWKRCQPSLSSFAAELGKLQWSAEPRSTASRRHIPSSTPRRNLQHLRRAASWQCTTRSSCAVRNLSCSSSVVRHHGAGQRQCPIGWQQQYLGYLMSEAADHHRSKFVCVDSRPEGAGISTTLNLDSMGVYPVETNCGSLPCNRYTPHREVACTVCTM